LFVSGNYSKLKNIVCDYGGLLRVIKI